MHELSRCKKNSSSDDKWEIIESVGNFIWSGQYSSLDMGLGATSDFSNEGRNLDFYVKAPDFLMSPTYSNWFRHWFVFSFVEKSRVS